MTDGRIWAHWALIRVNRHTRACACDRHRFFPPKAPKAPALGTGADHLKPICENVSSRVMRHGTGGGGPVPSTASKATPPPNTIFLIRNSKHDPDGGCNGTTLPSLWRHRLFDCSDRWRTSNRHGGDVQVGGGVVRLSARTPVHGTAPEHTCIIFV